MMVDGLTAEESKWMKSEAEIHKLRNQLKLALDALAFSHSIQENVERVMGELRQQVTNLAMGRRQLFGLDDGPCQEHMDEIEDLNRELASTRKMHTECREQLAMLLDKDPAMIQSPREQSAPDANADGPDVWAALIARNSSGALLYAMSERRDLGIARYGTPLRPHNGRDVNRDLREELLDALAYAAQRAMERDASSWPQDETVYELNCLLEAEFSR
jgi:hypothetical protein